MRRPRSTSEPRHEARAGRGEAGPRERPRRRSADGAPLGVVAAAVAGAREAAALDRGDAAAQVGAGEVEDDRGRRRSPDEEPFVDEAAGSSAFFRSSGESSTVRAALRRGPRAPSDTAATPATAAPAPAAAQAVERKSRRELTRCRALSSAARACSGSSRAPRRRARGSSGPPRGPGRSGRAPPGPPPASSRRAGGRLRGLRRGRGPRPRTRSSGGRFSIWIVCPVQVATAYSRAFPSSRTFPGQG